MAWFFVENPVDLGTLTDPRWVQRGALLHGGMDASSPAILEDDWVLDLTNLGDGRCPWVQLPNSGIPSYSSELAWDASSETFMLVSGYTTDGSTTWTDDTVWTASLDDLADGTGWVASGTLPALTYSASVLADTSASSSVTPLLYCANVVTRVPCMLSDGGLVTRAMAALLGGSTELCDSSDGSFDWSLVIGWADVLPCQPTLDCYDGGGNLLAEDMDNWYATACSDDPICDAGGANSAAGSSATASGLAEFTMTMDPATGTGALFGGTTGCDGSCAAWEDLEDLDGSRGDFLAMANADAVVEVSATGAAFIGNAWRATPPSTIPATSSFGRRAAASASSNLDWSLFAHAFSGSPVPIAIGGTLHQDLGIGRQHSVECTLANGDPAMLCNDFCVNLSSDWDEGAAAYLTEEAGLVTGTSVVSAWSDAAGAWLEQGDAGARAYAAGSWFGGDNILVWGGRGPISDRSDLFVWDADSGEKAYYSAEEPWGGRVGGAAAYDPVTRVAYLFGGANDATLYTYTVDRRVGGDNVTPTEGAWNGSNVTAGELVETMGYDGTTWTLGGEYGAEVACTSGVECFVEDLTFLIATESASEADTLLIDVDYPDMATTYAVSPYATFPRGDGFSLVYARLPRILTDGMAIGVTVNWEASTAELDTFDDCYDSVRKASALCSYPAGTDDTATTADERSTVALLFAPPVVPYTVASVPAQITTEFDLPSGWQGVAPGYADAAATTFTNSGHIVPDAQGYRRTTLAAIEGLSATSAASTTAGDTVTMWVDGGIDPTASAYGDYIGTGDGGFQSDVSWLETTVGSFPGGGRQLIILRPSYLEQAAIDAGSPPPTGLATSGMAWDFGADASGTPLWMLRTTSVHELAHAVLTIRDQPTQYFSADARWFMEGGPRLLEFMRFPDGAFYAGHGDTGSAQYGVHELYTILPNFAKALCDGVGDDIERNGTENLVAYGYGSYTFAELYWTYIARGGTDAGFWFHAVDFANTTPAPDSAAIQSLIESDLGLPYFYDQWVAGGRVGTPLLALTKWEPDTTSCTDTGECAPVGGLARVEQIQLSQMTTAMGCAADAPVFNDVPYFLYCDHADAGVRRSFDQCAADSTGLIDGVPSTLSLPDVDINLVESASLSGATPWPVDVRLLSADALIPSLVPNAGRYSSALHVRKIRVCVLIPTTRVAVEMAIATASLLWRTATTAIRPSTLRPRRWRLARLTTIVTACSRGVTMKSTFYLAFASYGALQCLVGCQTAASEPPLSQAALTLRDQVRSFHTVRVWARTWGPWFGQAAPFTDRFILVANEDGTLIVEPKGQRERTRWTASGVTIDASTPADVQPHEYAPWAPFVPAAQFGFAALRSQQTPWLARAPWDYGMMKHDASSWVEIGLSQAASAAYHIFVEFTKDGRPIQIEILPELTDAHALRIVIDRIEFDAALPSTAFDAEAPMLNTPYPTFEGGEPIYPIPEAYAQAQGQISAGGSPPPGGAPPAGPLPGGGPPPGGAPPPGGTPPPGGSPPPGGAPPPAGAPNGDLPLSRGPWPR